MCNLQKINFQSHAKPLLPDRDGQILNFFSNNSNPDVVNFVTNIGTASFITYLSLWAFAVGRIHENSTIDKGSMHI